MRDKNEFERWAMKRLSWAVVLLVASSLSGCFGFVRNIKPPYADPANPVPHAVMSRVEDPSGTVRLGFMAVDGLYAEYESNPRGGGHVLEKILVLPGQRTVTVLCQKLGGPMSAAVDLTLDLEADRHYAVSCALRDNGERAAFRIVDEQGRDVLFELRQDRQDR